MSKRKDDPNAADVTWRPMGEGGEINAFVTPGGAYDADGKPVPVGHATPTEAILTAMTPLLWAITRLQGALDEVDAFHDCELREAIEESLVRLKTADGFDGMEPYPPEDEG